MNDGSVVFRSAEPVATQPTATAPKAATVPQSRVIEDDDPTPYVYFALKEKPYAVKHFDLDNYWNDPDFQDVTQQLKELDDYVIRRAKARGLSDSHDSYKEIIDGVLKQIGKSKNEDPLQTVRRIHLAVGALHRLEKAKLPAILTADSLEPQEYEEIHGNRETE